MLYNVIASAQQFQFRRPSVGDSRAVVTSFMQDGTYPPRNFATLGPSGIRPPFTGTYVRASPLRFIDQHWAEVRLYTSSFNFAKSCVFKKQSPLLIYCDHLGTPSPEVTELICRVPSTLLHRHLSIFNPPTRVGFNTFAPRSYFLPRRPTATKSITWAARTSAGHFREPIDPRFST